MTIIYKKKPYKIVLEGNSTVGIGSFGYILTGSHPELGRVAAKRPHYHSMDKSDIESAERVSGLPACD